MRGSTIRGTVHTATPEQYAALGAATRVGQRTLWQRLLGLERSTVEDLWADTEEFAADWRSADELQAPPPRLADGARGPRRRSTEQQVGRYLAFGHGGLVRRPVNGDWAGQGAPGLPDAAARPCPRRRPTPCACTCAATGRPRGTTSRGGPSWGCASSTRCSTGWVSSARRARRAHVRRPAGRPRAPRRSTACGCCRSSTPSCAATTRPPGSASPIPATCAGSGARPTGWCCRRCSSTAGSPATGGPPARPGAGRWRWCGSPAPAGRARPSSTRRSPALEAALGITVTDVTLTREQV